MSGEAACSRTESRRHFRTRPSRTALPIYGTSVTLPRALCVSLFRTPGKGVRRAALPMFAARNRPPFRRGADPALLPRATAAAPPYAHPKGCALARPSAPPKIRSFLRFRDQFAPFCPHLRRFCPFQSRARAPRDPLQDQARNRIRQRPGASRRDARRRASPAPRPAAAARPAPLSPKKRPSCATGCAPFRRPAPLRDPFPRAAQPACRAPKGLPVPASPPGPAGRKPTVFPCFPRNLPFRVTICAPTRPYASPQPPRPRPQPGAGNASRRRLFQTSSAPPSRDPSCPLAPLHGRWKPRVQRTQPHVRARPRVSVNLPPLRPRLARPRRIARQGQVPPPASGTPPASDGSSPPGIGRAPPVAALGNPTPCVTILPKKKVECGPRAAGKSGLAA